MSAMQTLGNISQVRANLEAEALAWASQQGDQYRNEAMAIIQNERAVSEQKAAHKQAELENEALVWKANEDELSKSNLQAQLAELTQRAEAEHARLMAEEKAEHARAIANERDKTKAARAKMEAARRLNQDRSVKIANLEEQEKGLRAVIKTHEDAAQTQQQGVAVQSTQAKSLKKSLAMVAGLQTEVMSVRLWGSRKDVEIASLKEDKRNLTLQGQSIIAAKDATIKDLQDRLKKAEAENEKVSRVAKDLNTQVDKLKIEGSKTEDKLAAATSEMAKDRARKRVQRHFAKSKFSNGVADVADALNDFELGTSSSTVKRQAAGAVNLRRTTKGRVGKAASRASIQPRRQRRQGTDSDGQGTEESDG